MQAGRQHSNMVKRTATNQGSRSSVASIKTAGCVKKDFLKRSIARIMQLLKKKEDQVPVILDMLEHDSLVQVKDEDACWHDSYYKMSQIPKRWLASWLLTKSSSLTLSQLEVLDQECKDVIRRLCQFSTGVDFKDWKLPRAALRKEVLLRVMDDRYLTMGQRLSDAWIAEAVTQGNVDWTTAVFRLVMSDSEPTKVTHIQHIGGQRVAVPNELSCIQKSWQFQENWSDAKAAIKMGVLNISMTGSKESLFHNISPAKLCRYEPFEKECDAASERIKQQAQEAQKNATIQSLSPESTIGKSRGKRAMPKAASKVGLTL